jgi:hypothetical protein
VSGKSPVRFGRPRLHGGYSTRVPQDLVRGRARKRLRRYLSAFRSQLVEDVAGDESKLTAGQLALIDRATAKMTLIRLIEIYISEVGPWAAPGEMRPVLQQMYLKYTDSLRADLLALGIKRQDHEKVLTPAELVELIETEGEEKAKDEESADRKPGD